MPHPSRPFASTLFAASALLAACTGEVASTTTTGGGGGSGGAGGGGPGGAGPLCVPSKVGLDGSLAGAPFHASYPRTTGRLVDATFQSFFKTRGDVLLTGESNFTEGAAVGATGIFRMPAEGPSPGVVFCAGAGSSVTAGAGQKTFALASLGKLGACPGTPVSGQVTACLGDSSCITGNSLKGTIDAGSFDWSAAVTGWGGAIDIYQVYLNNGGVLVLDISLDTVLGGLLFMEPQGPAPGAVYCIGAGALQPGGPQPNAIQITASDLSRLGACGEASPASGAVNGCTP